MFNEKPPMLGGDVARDLAAIRDYLFRMARSLEEVQTAAGTGAVVTYGPTGQQIRTTSEDVKASEDIEAIRKNAAELRSLIIKSADDLQDQIVAGDDNVIAYTDRKVDEYNGLYVAKSEFGDFTETINTVIENTARGVVESYDYQSGINSLQDSIELMQNYYTAIDGEIRRGIVEDPETHEYVTGIAIAQVLRFSGECGPSDEHNPGDGYTYYYMNEGQTFGLYTSVGWQFWVNGYRKGWYSSIDGMLHVAGIYVENTLQLGPNWAFVSPASNELEIRYIGG